MRLALDEQIFAIQRFGGISRMFAELARQFVLHTAADVEISPIDAPIVNRYILDDPQLAQALQAYQAKNEWTALARYMSRIRRSGTADIVHNTFYLPHGLPVNGKARRVVTVHDMIPEMLPSSRRRLDWLTLKKRYVMSADHVICVSQATKHDLLETYGQIRAPISVVYHGVDERFSPQAERLDFLPNRYILFVGNRGQYKDADVFFTASAKILKDFDDMRILCIGGSGLSPQEINRLTELGIRERVSQRYLPDELIVSAYAHAELFVFPSRFEGFGLPALEAMASGTPTILARATSLPEVGGEAALYFDPGDPNDLQHVMRRVLESGTVQQELRSLGLDRARQFTWARSARQTALVYEKALR